jgi:GR25 family glycosyltransferase involved in LPS biosynthesis
MIPLAFINLKRRPDRRESIEEQMETQKIDKIYRYVAKDAREYQFTEDELSVFSRADFLRDQKIARAIMCNFLSHYDLWDFMVENKISNMVILQDDAVIKPNFWSYVYAMSLYLPEDAEVVWLGIPEQVSLANFYRIGGESWMTDTTPYVSTLSSAVNPCSLAYFLTLEGAKNLKERAQTVGVNRALDHWMNDYLKTKKIFYSSSEVLVTNQPAFGSDIF